MRSLRSSSVDSEETNMAVAAVDEGSAGAAFGGVSRRGEVGDLASPQGGIRWTCGMV